METDVLTEKLLNAARAGELFRVRYFGGSTPGAERQLRPISVEDGKVRALCMLSGETKSFVIAKMEEVIQCVPSARAMPLSDTAATFESVEEILLHHQSALESQGWVVQVDGKSVSLHRTFKNGKLVQAPDVALSFESETYDSVFDGEQVVEANRRERSRPWTLHGKNKTTKTFTDLAKAQSTFLAWANELAPITAK